MFYPSKVIVQFRKNGKRVTTKTVSSPSGQMSDFAAVLEAESILQKLVANHQIPARLLDYDTIRLNNARDIPVTETGPNKGAFSMMAKDRAVLVQTLNYLKR